MQTKEELEALEKYYKSLTRGKFVVFRTGSLAKKVYEVVSRAKRKFEDSEVSYDLIQFVGKNQDHTAITTNVFHPLFEDKGKDEKTPLLFDTREEAEAFVEELNAKIKANEFLWRLKELMEKYDVTISYKVNELGISRRSSMAEFDSCSAMNIYVGKCHAMEGKTFHPYIKADDIDTIDINAY